MSPAATRSREALLSSERPARCLLRASSVQSLSLFHPQPYPIQCKLAPGAHKLSCVSRRMAFPIQRKKRTAAGQCPTRPVAAGLTSSPEAPSRSRVPVWERMASGCSWRASGEYCPSLASLWLPWKENGGDKTFKGLSRPGLHCSLLLGMAWHLGLNQGPGTKEGKARRSDVASRRPRLEYGRSF